MDAAVLFSWIYRHPDWINSSKRSANCTVHLNGVFTLKSIYNLVNIIFIIYWFACLLEWHFRLLSVINGVFKVFFFLGYALYFILSPPWQFQEHTCGKKRTNLQAKITLLKIKIFLKHQTGNQVSQNPMSMGTSRKGSSYQISW